MASFRPRSLQSLLRSLQSASYDDDQVELELCVDGLPAVSPTDKEKAKHAEVRRIIDEFAWTQGPLSVTEERESKKGPGETGDWKGKGAFGAFLSSWQPSASNPHQVLLLLPEYVVLSPVYYQYVKRLVSHYYLNRQHHDSPHVRSVAAVLYARAGHRLRRGGGAAGRGAAVPLPGHGKPRHCVLPAALAGLPALAEQPSSTARSTACSCLCRCWTPSPTPPRRPRWTRRNLSSPCIPTLASNAWWLAWNDKYGRAVPSNVTLDFAIDHLHPLFFTRWLWEAGYYALFPHVAEAAALVQQSDEDKVRTVYAWSADKENALRGEAEAAAAGRARLASQLPLPASGLPQLHSLPLFDVQGWDVNGHLHQPTSDDNKPAAPDEEPPAAAATAAGDEAAEALSSLSLASGSKQSARQRSRVLQYRPLQYSHTSQCSIVRRDRRREQQREQQLVLSHPQQQQQNGAGGGQQAGGANKRSKAAQANTPLPPLAAKEQQREEQRYASDDGAQQTRARSASTDNEGEEEEAVNRADNRWKG